MSLRCQILEIMLTLGVFSEFQHGDDLDDAVYQTAATIPLNGFNIDPDTFVQYIKRREVQAVRDAAWTRKAGRK